MRVGLQDPVILIGARAEAERRIQPPEVAALLCSAPVKASRSHLAAVLLVVCSGCGGGSSPGGATTRPPLPTPTPVPAPVFLDGWTEQPASGAGATPSALVVRQPMSATAPGYLIREQLFTGGPIYLWPTDETYVSELVYNWRFGDGSYRMVKWGGPLIVTLEGDLAENTVIVAKVQEALEEVHRVSGLAFRVGPGGACTISIDPSIRSESNVVGQVRWTSFRGPNITSAEILFSSRGEITGGTGSDYRNTLLHELGHVLGLNHSPNARDIMAPGGGAKAGGIVGQYQEGEAVALRMMYRDRTAGSFPPDRDSALGVRASSSVSPVVRVIRD
jgi:hypothetical protein